MNTTTNPLALMLAISGMLAILAIVLFFAPGTTGKLVGFAVVTLLVISHVTHRYAHTRLGGRYPCHGDRMD
jgi:hypothetical protein